MYGVISMLDYFQGQFPLNMQKVTKATNVNEDVIGHAAEASAPRPALTAT